MVDAKLITEDFSLYLASFCAFLQLIQLGQACVTYVNKHVVDIYRLFIIIAEYI